jgi:hypothetical protein
MMSKYDARRFRAVTSRDKALTEGDTGIAELGAPFAVAMGGFALARAVMATSGRAVAVRAVPLFCGIGLIAAIVFGGHGVQPRTMVALLEGSLGARLVMFASWTMLASPAVARAFDAPGTITLRALRPPRTALFALLLAIAVFVQLPWMTLFAFGGGTLRALSYALLAAAACASMPGFAVACAIVALAPLPVVALPTSFAVAAFSVAHAWRTAFEHRDVVRIVRRAPPAMALAMTYVARMARATRARVNAAALVIVAGEGALALSLRNDADARPVTRALVVLAFPFAIASALLAAPAVETEARLLPLLRSTRTKTATLALAMVLALAVPSTAFAATASIAASNGTTIVSSAYAFVLASCVALWARRASRARRSTTFLLGVAVIATAFTIAGATC